MLLNGAVVVVKDRLHQHVVPQKPSAMPAVQASFITLLRMYLTIMIR